MRYFFVLITSLLLLVSCSQKTQTPRNTKSSAKDNTETRMENMAKELCDCSEDFFQMMADVEKYVNEEDIKGLERVEKEFPKVEKEMYDCLDKLEKEYPEIDKPEMEDAVIKALEKHCPQMAEVAKMGKEQG